jgi:hypothetical protein
MIKKIGVMLGFICISLLLVACDDQGELKDDFDPTPYLAEAFQSLTNYEQVLISPQTAKWIYSEETGENLSVLFLFTSFGRTGESGTFYAMMTIYLNKAEESVEASFIDRIYYDELGASQTSAQGYQSLYNGILEQRQAASNATVELGDLTFEVISSAMQSVSYPN